MSEVKSFLPSKVEKIENSYRLAPMQEGMLFHSLYTRETGVDIEQLLCTLHESINLTEFEQAWQQVVERHPILRTSFHWQDLKEPIQQVHQQAPLPLEVQDWRGFTIQEQHDRLNAFLEVDRQRGFELTQSPLMRLSLFQLADAQYQLVWTFHHILLDGRSFPIILKEVFDCYEALCQGKSLQIAPLRPYRDYIHWLYQQDFSETATYWRQLLEGFATPTPLPVAKVSRNLFGNTGHSVEQIQLSTSTTTALQILAQQHGLTVNTIVQGAWALLLNHYAETGDVVFGATRACRHFPLEEAESMVGLFINTLPVRVRVSSEASLLQWLKELREQHIAIRPYEHTPLTQVQKWSEVAPGTPLFNSLVVFENYSINAALQAQGGHWKNREFELIEQPSYPLVLIGHLDSELSLKVTYDRSQFDRDTVHQMLGRLNVLLEGIAANPEQRLADYSFLTESERHQILVEWNATEVDYPKHLRLQDLFEAKVQESPNAVAVIFDGKQLTYRELNGRANQLAHHLQAMGVKPEVAVGICVERSLEMIIGVMAIVKAGGAYVPLDPTYPQDRLAHILSDAQLAMVLTQEKLLPLLPQQAIPTLCLDTGWQKVAAESEANPTSLVTAENLAYIIYTSGSTGKPKGVLIEHRGAVNTILDINDRFQVGSNDRVLAVCSLNFDLSVYDIFGLLAAGGTIVIPKPAIAPDLNDWINLMVQNQVTLWNSAPPVMQMFAGHLVDFNHRLPASLRLVLLSGDWIPLTLPGMICQLKDGDKDVEVISLGGATEASIWSILYPIEAIDPEWKSIPYGKPMANQQFYVLDEQRKPVPVGKVGELYIGGDGVARGYHNRPDLNETKFLPNPFSQKAGACLYRTGDLGRYMPDGNIEFLGRIDHQVKIRGFRIELGEIEIALTEHPAIRETAIIAREDVPGDKRLVAYLVLETEKNLSIAEASQADQPDHSYLIEGLRSFLKERLPDYMVPSAFVVLDALPLTPNGKLDRKALPAPHPAGQAQSSDTTSLLTAPRDEIEQKLIEIWQEFLGVPTISVKDNFFELGGHSLLAVRLWAKVEKTFQRELPLATLFQAPTIEQLADRLRLPGELPLCPSLVVIQPGQPEAKPPLFCLHVLGRGLKFCRPFTRYLDPQQPVYGLSTHIAGEPFECAEVEVLAAHYIKQIEALQPNGPYLLAGVSLGGLIALEVAQQLVAQGQKVALLALLDTQVPGEDASVGASEKLLDHWEQLSEKGLIYVFQKLRDVLVGKTQALTTWLRESYYGVSTEFYQKAGFPLPDYLQDYVYRMQNEQSAASYIPQTYAGQVKLFKATGLDNSEVGWKKLALGGLEVYEMPGTHLGMLSEPHVRVLGETLQSCIAEIISVKQF